MIAIGSGIGLLSIASIVSDFLLEYLSPQKKEYVENKYDRLTLDDEDDDVTLMNIENQTKNKI